MTSITFQGNPVTVFGALPAIGAQAPNFTLVNSELTEVTLESFIGKKKVLNIVPSLDTPTCAASARKFNEKAAHLPNTEVLLVSADLPFAQCRFCDSEGLTHVTALSTFRSGFAEEYGVKIMDTLLAGLTARAIVILDEENKVIYTQLVKELTDEPDYESAWAALHH